MAYSQYFLTIAFSFLAISGVAVGYVASDILLEIVAYLSPWMPTWSWYIIILLYILAVSISASGVVGIIGSVADSSKAIKTCWLVITVVFGMEILLSTFASFRRHELVGLLHNDIESSMEHSIGYYSTNISDTQMWDEIQLEVNCCGVQSYKDWFDTDFGAQTSVPDSCCLLVNEGCGQNISSKTNPGEYIITKGCHPIILTFIVRKMKYFAYHICLPVLFMHSLLLILIFGLVHRKRSEGNVNRIYLISPTSFPRSNSSPKYSSLKDAFYE